MKLRKPYFTLLFLISVSQTLASSTNFSNPDSLFNLADQYFEHNDTTRGFQLLDSMLQLYSSEDTMVSDILNEYGYYYYLMGSSNQSLHYYQRSLALEQAMSDTVRIIGRLKNIGMTYWDMGRNQSALNHYLEALKLAQLLNRPQSIASVNNSLAVLMYEMEQYDKAKEYYEVALKEWTHLKDTLRLSYVYNNIGQVYYDQADYDSALLFYQQALHWKRQIDQSRTLPTTLYNLGNTYLSLQHLDTASYYLKESYRIAQQYDMKGAMASASNSLGELYLSSEQISTARSYLDTTKILLNQLDSRSIRLEYFRLEALYHEKTDQTARALSYQKQWAALRDSLFNEERLKVMETQAEYTLHQEEQARENAELRASIAQAESEQHQRYTLAALSGGAILTVISIVLFRLYNLNRRMKDRNADLVREVHHRVKNNLHSISSLLSLQSRRLEDDGAKKAMSETQLRIQSMGLIHRRLYGNQLTDVNMREYLEELIPQVLDSFGCKADLQLSLDDVMLDVDQAVPVGLITNEVISNACKYAFPDHTQPTLKVTFQPASAQSYLLVIQDNGPGIDLDKCNGSKTFGTKLIHLQTDQLGGKADYQIQDGTLFQLTFPRK
ncbi:tetratricopeptide repeat protein [Catalinimonas sp. 4WD22]|uniref:tetratricopeptide repeat protein n=1 Tax=Catalinimonas locisalis TaxID=3133978 RepID=UPI003101979E